MWERPFAEATEEAIFLKQNLKEVVEKKIGFKEKLDTKTLKITLQPTSGASSVSNRNYRKITAEYGIGLNTSKVKLFQ